MLFTIHPHESATGTHVFPHPEPPSHLPPHPIPLAYPRAPALSSLLHASNLHWPSVLRMVIYMFQCYPLKLSHPCLLTQSTKVCSLHLCLFRCLAYRVIIIIFLNSIYMYWCIQCTPIYCIGVFLSDLTWLCIICYSFIHLIRTDSNAFSVIAE